MKKFIVIADIHANLAALEAVLVRLKEFEHEVICLGDVVGYGPNPAEVIERLRELDVRVLKGNHDAAVADMTGFHDLRYLAREVAHWTRQQLNGVQMDYLLQLPMSIQQGNFTFFHGSPTRPLREYVEKPVAVCAALQMVEKHSHLGLGHLHKPLCWLGDDAAASRRLKINVDEKISFVNKRMLFNPGSVGQPRDDDPRASFAVVDPEEQTIVFRRVEYDVEKVRNQIEEAGLPRELGLRLSRGC